MNQAVEDLISAVRLPQAEYLVPEDVWIGAQRYKVVVDDLSKRGLLGHCDADNNLMELSNQQSLQRLRESMLHEVLHASMTEAGFSDGPNPIEVSQEELVARLTPVILYWLRVNPELMVFLLSHS